MATYNSLTLQTQLVAAGLPIVTAAIGANPAKVPVVPGTYTYYTAPDGVTIIGVDWSVVPTTAQSNSAAAIIAANNYLGTQPSAWYSLATAIFTLSSSQKTNLINYLFGGSPAPYQLDAGPNYGAIAAIYAACSNASGVATFNQAQQLLIAALYTVDNPRWLMQPAFDPTINISGYLT